MRSENSQGLEGRLGISIDYENDWQDEDGSTGKVKLYGIANLYADMLDGSTTLVAGTPFASRNDTLAGGLGLGGTLSLQNGKYAMRAEAMLKTDLPKLGEGNSARLTGDLTGHW